MNSNVAKRLYPTTEISSLPVMEINFTRASKPVKATIPAKAKKAISSLKKGDEVEISNLTSGQLVLFVKKYGRRFNIDLMEGTGMHCIIGANLYYKKKRILTDCKVYYDGYDGRSSDTPAASYVSKKGREYYILNRASNGYYTIRVRKGSYRRKCPRLYTK